MIVTVTPNACIDVTYRVPGFTLDRVNRPTDVVEYAGGKGINVSRVLHRLKSETFCIGFLAGATGDEIEKALHSEGLEGEFIRLEGNSRRCLAIVDPNTGTQTEVNEWGPHVNEADVERLQALLIQTVERLKPSTVVFSGSLPPGAPPETYQLLIASVHTYGVRTVLDTGGEPLKLGLRAQPWMAKPNQHELSGLSGLAIESIADAVKAARYQQHAVQYGIAVSMGAQGAVLCTETECLHAKPPAVTFVSSVGSGDSFVAGYLFSEELGMSAKDRLKWACACGAANAEVYGSGFVLPERVAQLADLVQVKTL